jgi:hypothetical protein
MARASICTTEQRLLQLMGGQLGVKPEVGARTSELNRLPRQLVFRALAGEHRPKLGGDRLKDACPALVLSPAMVGEESEHRDLCVPKIRFV